MNGDLHRYLSALPRRGGVSIELDLSEEGYRRLATLTERLAMRFPAMDLGQCLVLVIEAGTEAVENQIQFLGREIQ